MLARGLAHAWRLSHVVAAVGLAQPLARDLQVLGGVPVFEALLIACGLFFLLIQSGSDPNRLSDQVRVKAALLGGFLEKTVLLLGLIEHDRHIN